MKHDYLFLDFDQTLFDHWAFAQWMDEFFVERFGIAPLSFLRSFDEHHNQLPEGLRLYRHVSHIQQVTGKSWGFVSGEVERESRHRDLDFCYPEVHGVLSGLADQQSDTRILTFGDGEYQRFKINTCHFLRRSQIGVHVVAEPKRVFLEREFQAGSGVLVDDKFPLRLPGNWRHMWISRKSTLNRPLLRQDGVIQISTMNQLEQGLKLHKDTHN